MNTAQTSRLGENKPILVKLVLVGKLGVGKSAMIVRFLTKRFIGEYDQNIGLMYHYHKRLENQQVRVEILESGGKDFIESSDVHTLWGDLFLLVYAINDRSSFEELIPLRQHLEKVRAADKPLVVLIGNKKDTENDREVSKQEGLQFSKENNCSFYEISTKASYEEVENVFSEAIRDIARHKLTQRALNGVKQTSHNKIMEIVEKNVGRNRAMSSVKETIDEYCATRSEELSQDLSRDRRNTFT
ncbi:unnamed protein product [Porites lobata]|uniref:small monomeric GTPase n=1 Tax=Porites lobata TaxID=104759 RepID=A0ABN8NX28_9CNID|nr:unnamed protein product [Porites lobata]